jgi:RNA polymerase sigma-32 factor
MPVDDMLSNDESKNLLTKSLLEFRKTLSGKEADIFDNRILAEKPLTLQDLGNKYKISRERIRQIQEKIIKNIRKWLKEKIPNFEEEYSDFLK